MLEKEKKGNWLMYYNIAYDRPSRQSSFREHADQNVNRLEHTKVTCCLRFIQKSYVRITFIEYLSTRTFVGAR